MSDTVQIALITAVTTAAATAIPIVISDVLKTWLAWRNIKSGQKQVLEEAQKSTKLTENNISQTTRIEELVNGKTDALKQEIIELKKRLEKQ